MAGIESGLPTHHRTHARNPHPISRTSRFCRETVTVQTLNVPSPVGSVSELVAVRSRSVKNDFRVDVRPFRSDIGCIRMQALRNDARVPTGYLSLLWDERNRGLQNRLIFSSSSNPIIYGYNYLSERVSCDVTIIITQFKTRKIFRCSR